MHLKLIFYIDLFIGEEACPKECIWKSEDSVQKSVSPSYSVGSREWIQATRLGSKGFTHWMALIFEV